ncbi:MAG: polysulfide reductase NrfD [Myxococcales bacterium]|nr:polysulfide reductase NrfD [Myxococcales bacterium]
MDPETIEVISTRHNANIDPHLALWGWEIPAYLFLGGLVAGIMVLAAVLELSRKEKGETRAAELLPFLAASLISLGMLFLFLDLHFKLHVFRFYTAFRPSSPMSWGAWLLLLVYPVLGLLGLGGLREESRRWLRERVRPAWLKRPLDALFSLADARRRPILWATIASGSGLGLYTGLLLGTMVARPVWNTSVLAPLFLVSGVSTGAALMLLLPMGTTDAHKLVRWDTAAIVIELTLIGAWLLGGLTGGTTSQGAAALFLGGPYTAVFWGLFVMAGLLVPLALNLIEIRRGIAGTRYGPALVLIGGLALRAILVSAGQLTSLTHLG